LGGRTERYAEIVTAYQSMLTSYAAFRLPDPAMVDEVVQQTFVRAFEQLDRFDPAGDFGVWLRTICHYFILSEQKRAAQELKNLSRFRERIAHHLLVASSERAGIDPAHAEEDRVALLRQCRDKLAPNLQELLRLRYEDGRQLAGIARQMGRSESWVSTTLFRVRATLRECIERRAEG
jgi:RNA polymerase sigma-70 factor (ECF subfamily)